MTQLTQRLGDALEARAGGIQGALASPVRTSRMAVVLGRLLASAFVICLLTGLYSHFLQQPLSWMVFPTHPANLYAITQGVHITVGIVIFPLLFAKLWVIYPKLFAWPPFDSVLKLVERGSTAVLVSSAVLEPVIGLINTYQWYPWSFSFRRAHYGLAWVLVGSIAVHVAVKLPLIIDHWRRPTNRDVGTDGTPPSASDEAEVAEEVVPPAGARRSPQARRKDTP